MNDKPKELKEHSAQIFELGCMEPPVYLKEEVDAAIAELKRKLEDAQATAYVESVDAGMRERRLKRALWIAHEYKAKFKRWWLHLALDYEASMIRPDAKTINRIKGKIGNCEKSERKCRANQAKITDMDGHEVLHSQYDNNFEYRLGQEIEIKDFNLMYNVECASGFHFFRTRKEAEEYNG